MVLVDDAMGRQSLLLRGSLDMCVLALLDRTPRHAYGVVEELAEFGLDQVSYGTIYPLVTRLRRQGLVDQRSEASRGGPSRNILTTTRDGQAALARWRQQWHETAGKVSALIGEPGTIDLEGESHVV